MNDTYQEKIVSKNIKAIEKICKDSKLNISLLKEKYFYTLRIYTNNSSDIDKISKTIKEIDEILSFKYNENHSIHRVDKGIYIYIYAIFQQNSETNNTKQKIIETIILSNHEDNRLKEKDINNEIKRKFIKFSKTKVGSEYKLLINDD